MSYNNKIGMAVAVALLSAGALILWRRRRNSAAVPTLLNDDMNKESLDYWDLRKYNDKELSRGYRNNNPVNIDYYNQYGVKANDWKGQTGVEPEGRFAQFVSIPYGYRAALVLLRNYITNKGANTIRKIIERFAPSNENYTDEYMRFVSNKTGIGLDTVLNPYDKETMCTIVYAITLFENRVTDVSKALNLPNMDLILEGWRLL